MSEPTPLNQPLGNSYIVVQCSSARWEVWARIDGDAEYREKVATTDTKWWARQIAAKLNDSEGRR